MPDENEDEIDCSQCGTFPCTCKELFDDEEDELEVCPYCQRFVCICESIDGDLDVEEERYLDKRLSDREDFHSDESVGPIDIEPYYPEY